MNRTKFDRIVDFYEKNKIEIEQNIYTFKKMNELPEVNFIDIGVLATTLLDNKNVVFIHLPLSDAEAGAFYVAIAGKTFVFVNSKKSKADNNFSIAHEIYHVMFHKNNKNTEVETMSNTYGDSQEEYFANAFSGSLLMPADSFKPMFNKYYALERKKQDTINNVLFAVVLRLMSVFKTTYMSVVIRAYELCNNVFDDGIIKYLLEQNEPERIEIAAEKLHLYKDILLPTYRDDSKRLAEEIQNAGKRLVADGKDNVDSISIVMEDYYDAIYECTGVDLGAEPVREQV